MSRPQKTWTWLAALAASALIPTAPAQEPLKPFTAAYEVVYRGMNAGTTTLELTSEGPDRWRYVSKANARGIFRLVLSGEIRQTSQFTLTDGAPRPLRYVADDGTEDVKRDIRLDFDWKAGRVRGTAETKPVDLPLREGLQDGMSVQIALIRALLAGERPRRFFLIDKDEVKEFVYDPEGSLRLKTAVGELETLAYSSHRPTSDRVTRVWYAPSLGYTPVKAERRRGDKLEWTMQLKSLQR
ncbi:MAG: DUF3108 domain-containing protein [Gammaproteobacteria bacterium]|nr:DUF3108 domain-containing protein [Gammaproteobacteria bacterium]